MTGDIDFDPMCYVRHMCT